MAPTEVASRTMESWEAGSINQQPLFLLPYNQDVFIFSFFPETAIVKAESMNWNFLIYGFTIIFAIVWFFARGKRQYAGPVEYVRNGV
jgi:hypothetical protein